jgi:hypothetical protein
MFIYEFEAETDEERKKELVAEIQRVEVMLSFDGALPKSQSEQEGWLDWLCHMSTLEAHYGTQSSKRQNSFFWVRKGGGYYSIWKDAVDLPGVARLVYFGQFKGIWDSFMQENNGWHGYAL